MEGKKGKYLEKNADKEESVLGSNQSIVFNIAVCQFSTFRIIPDNFAAYKKDHPGFPQTL